MDDKKEPSPYDVPDPKAIPKMKFPEFPSDDWKVIDKNFEWRFNPSFYRTKVWQNGDFYAFETYFNPDDSRAKDIKGKIVQLDKKAVVAWVRTVSQFYQDTLLDVKIPASRKKIVLIFSKMMNEQKTFKWRNQSVTLRKLPDDPAAIRISAGAIPTQALYMTYRGDLAIVKIALQDLLDVVDAQLGINKSPTKHIILPGQ